jgi:hypothetical protein
MFNHRLKYVRSISKLRPNWELNSPDSEQLDETPPDVVADSRLCVSAYDACFGMVRLLPTIDHNYSFINQTKIDPPFNTVGCSFTRHGRGCIFDNGNIWRPIKMLYWKHSNLSRLHQLCDSGSTRPRLFRNSHCDSRSSKDAKEIDHHQGTSGFIGCVRISQRQESRRGLARRQGPGSPTPSRI